MISRNPTITRGNAKFRAGRRRNADFEIEVQGLETLREHFAAIAGYVGPLTFHVVDFHATVMKENAQRIVPVDTGELLQSIHKGDAGGGEANPQDGMPVAVGDGWQIDIGPSADHGRFVEFGTVYMFPRPYMIPASDMTEPAFLESMFQVASLVDEWNPMSKISEPNFRSMISGMRSKLYSTGKFAGDINAIAGRSIFPGRSGIYGSARILGDVNSIMSSTINSRIQRRLSGRVTGHLAGLGSATLFAEKTYSTTPGGSGGQRIYNRLAGRVLSRGAGIGSSGGLSIGSLGSFR